MPNPAIDELSQPRLHLEAREVQVYGTVIRELPVGLAIQVREESAEELNQILANTMVLRDLYKKAHWQVSGPAFYQLHLLFDQHHETQLELIDAIAERIQMLGGVSLAVAQDVAEMSSIPRAPRGREEASVQISRLLDAHEILIAAARLMARKATERGDDGTNDLLVGQVLRTSEKQAWFLFEHLVNLPLAAAK